MAGARTDAPRAVAPTETRLGVERARHAVDHQPAVDAADLHEVGEIEKRARLSRAPLDPPRVDRREVALELEVVREARLVVAEPKPPALERLEDLRRQRPRPAPPPRPLALPRGGK